VGQVKPRPCWPADPDSIHLHDFTRDHMHAVTDDPGPPGTRQPVRLAEMDTRVGAQPGRKPQSAQDGRCLVGRPGVRGRRAEHTDPLSQLKVPPGMGPNQPSCPNEVLGAQALWCNAKVACLVDRKRQLGESLGKWSGGNHGTKCAPYKHGPLKLSTGIGPSTQRWVTFGPISRDFWDRSDPALELEAQPGHRLFAHLHLPDLPGDGHREAVPHIHVAGDLVVGELAPAERGDI
jgi:hypothetical protein